jgi:hypothetical protein
MYNLHQQIDSNSKRNLKPNSKAAQLLNKGIVRIGYKRVHNSRN